jgi:hypothetical protein
LTNPLSKLVTPANVGVPSTCLIETQAMEAKMPTTRMKVQTLLRPGLVAAALVISSSALGPQVAFAALVPESGLRNDAKILTSSKKIMPQNLCKTAALKVAPAFLSQSEPPVRQIVWFSTLRLLIARLRIEVVRGSIIAALEKIVEDLAKGISPEKIRQSLCAILGNLRDNVARNKTIKVEARADILQLVAELKQVFGCNSLLMKQSHSGTP